MDGAEQGGRVATRDVFTDEELDQLRRFPDISREELIRYFTLTPADEAFVVARHGAANRLGAAVQLCSLPWLGFVPDDVVSAPPVAVARLSERLRIPVGELVDYGSREQTRTDHLREVDRYLGWRLAEEFQWRELDEFLFARAMEHDLPKLLFRLGCEYLASSRVIRPGVGTVLMRVAAAREKSRAETWQRVAHLVEPTRAAELDRLLVVDPLVGFTRLHWLCRGATQPVQSSESNKWVHHEQPVQLRGSGRLDQVRHPLPGRITREEARYSQPSRNNSFGGSCSIALANRNSSSSRHWNSSASRHPR